MRNFSTAGCFAATLLLSAFSSSLAHAAPPVPPAFQGFCARYAGDCQPHNAQPAALPWTPERMAELRQINDRVNRSIREATDAEIYGRADVWTLPVRGVGDCEDFALEKRHELIAMGWPSSALLVTVVRDQNGEGHAVLSAVFDKGDYILDNRNRSVLARSQTPYTYYIRQSAANPVVWVWVGAPAPAVRSVAAVR